MDFMLALSKNILGIQLFIGSFQSFADMWQVENIYFKEHPLNIGYKGTEEPIDWIEEKVTEYYPSFFAFWKKLEKQLP